MLLLGNQVTIGAFSADRLDAVILIADLLAVSMDDASVHESPERKVAKRTEAVEKANKQLQTS